MVTMDYYDRITDYGLKMQSGRGVGSGRMGYCQYSYVMDGQKTRRTKNRKHGGQKTQNTFASLTLRPTATTKNSGCVVKKFACNGVAGYVDRELGSAVYNKPKSFAVDFKGNVYVADRVRHTIRKISKSGVSTIAGGYSPKTGKIDGPAQNASFSDDFELAFIPEKCAILISDHGNRLVRQIKLKAEDCLYSWLSIRCWGDLSLGSRAWTWTLLLAWYGCRICVSALCHFTWRTEISNLQHDMEPLLNESGETSGDAVLRYQKRSC